jgi:hypothetical protein
MGRPPIGKPTVVRFRPGVAERIDATLREGEVRADFIRDAVDALLAQREAPKGKRVEDALPKDEPLREVRVLVSDLNWKRMLDEGIRNLVRGKRPSAKRKSKGKS